MPRYSIHDSSIEQFEKKYLIHIVDLQDNNFNFSDEKHCGQIEQMVHRPFRLRKTAALALRPYFQNACS